MTLLAGTQIYRVSNVSVVSCGPRVLKTAMIQASSRRNGHLSIASGASQSKAFNSFGSSAPFGALSNSRKNVGLFSFRDGGRIYSEPEDKNDVKGTASLSYGPPGGNGNGSGDGHGGDGDGASGGGGAGAALLAGRALESLPADLTMALKENRLPLDVAQRYLDLSKNAFFSWLMQFAGFRERLLADPGFMVKVAIEVGIGICTKTTAEYTKRGDNFQSQLDFVAANIMMALVADFMLVWLPAPTYSPNKKPASPGLLAKMFAGCPENAFQKVPAGYSPFTIGQRLGSVVRNGTKLFGVGFFASLLGVGFTNGLILVRQMLDPTFVPLNDPQDVLLMSAAYGTYMATSSNLRYQVVAGVIEERGVESIFRNSPAVCAALSLVIRTGNTFLGSLWWVDFLNLVGLQSINKGG